MKRRSIQQLALTFLGLSVTGCGHAPSFNLLGSYFPAWLVCLPVAILLTVIVRTLARRLEIEEYLRPVFLSYLAVWAFFIFCLWLLFFS